MTEKLTKDFFEKNYNDDFTDSDNYHRVLFNNGRYVQSRELTQMQTIINAEMKRFGDNIFKDGAAVNPAANVGIDNSHRFVKLNTTSNTLPADLTTIIGETFVGSTSNVKCRILEIVEGAGSDPSTIFVQYTDGNASSTGSYSVTVTAGENIVGDTTGTVLTVQTVNTVSNPAVGKGTRVSVGSGEFYVQGHFVFAKAQSIVLSKYTSNPSAVVGFKITEDIVTATDDVNLYDNSGSTPNLSAPGADRYRITLTLINETDIASDENFVYVAKITDGEIVNINKADSTYNVLLDVLARRTSEESGNYVVKPFISKFEAHDSDATKLNMNIAPGVGYVEGYRIDPGASTLEVLKPITTSLVENEVVAANYGNYIEVSLLKGLPDISSFEKWNLYNAITGGGSVIGNARVRGVERDGSKYRIYLFEVVMNSGADFRTVRSIGSGTTEYGNLVLENSVAVLKETNNNDAFFTLPLTRPSSISDISLNVERYFTGTTNGSGELSISLSSTGETFSSTTEWIATVDSSGDVLSPSITGSGTAAAALTALPTSSAVKIIALVNKGGSSGSTRTKTLTEATVTVAIDSDGAGLAFLDLGKADVYDVSRVTLVDSDGENTSASYFLDNGQRDNFYGVGKMILTSGGNVPAGNVFVRFRYFQHGASGNFFGINSYSGQLDYKDIPSYRQQNGTRVELRNVMDFRSRFSDDASGFSASSARVNEMPQNTDLITADITYYNRRKDKLILNRSGSLVYLKGTPGLDPKYPVTPAGSMDLYNIELGPNTLTPKDISMSYIDNRRYTMRDIAKLDKKINKVEELAVLSLLDLSAASIEVLDSDGFSRTKAGFLTDDFKSHQSSDVNNLEYRASIDPTVGLLRPSFREKNVRMFYDSDLSTNIILKGDKVFLKYTEELFLDQPKASRIQNINPFSVIDHKGNIELSPSTDEWRDVITSPVSITGGPEFVLGVSDIERSISATPNLDDAEGFTGGGTLEELIATLRPRDAQIVSSIFDTVSLNWDGVNWGWFGTEPDDQGNITQTLGIQERGAPNGRAANSIFIPFIRSRRISFRAEGLLPNAQHWAFFDGRRIDNWVREEAFARLAAGNTNPRIGASNLTQHPEGPTNLVSDANGIIEGSFFIPNTDALRFSTGVRRFSLYDITVEDKANSASRGITYYFANGTQEVRVVPPAPPAVINNNDDNDNWPVPDGVRGIDWDPIAQSFYIDNKTGVYITKIRAFFSSKDAIIPVECQIRPMVNGYPSSSEVIKGGIKFLNPSQVVISADATSGTDFVFDAPIFLEPNKEYAVMLKSPCLNYNVWISRMGDFELGSTERKITSQPSIGSLYKSQNSFVWEPFQSEDLKFEIYRADFEASGKVVFENTEVARRLLPSNPVLLDSGDATVRMIHPNHGLLVNDNVVISGMDSADTLGGIRTTSIMGARSITKIDGSGYTFEADSSPSSNARGGGFATYATDNMMMDLVYPSIEEYLPEGTSSSYTAKFTSGKSLAGSETPYGKSTTAVTIKPYEKYVFDTPHVVMGHDIEEGELGSGVKSATIEVNLVSNSTFLTPEINAGRSSLTGINNVIDNQDSSATSGFNVPITWRAETDPRDGTSLAKHITKAITLEETAVGLKVIFGANRPSESDFKVYYKISTDTQLSDINWIEAVRDTFIPSDNNPDIFREYRYTVGGPTGTLTQFASFKLKIVMTSKNSSKVPVIRDLRVIALAV
jgi:hypothetical protein